MWLGPLPNVMAGLVPAIHVLLCATKNVDARDKPGHDGQLGMSRDSLRCQLTRFQVWPPQNMPPKAQPCTRSAFGPFIAIVES
ncbi:hypothetical protein FBZ96_105200 [Bradyrhizobium stylosanthis]|uniref:Uncharacterized protein n=1 Tax=Bradyrhizobium stylosanthis TaxID=1803665 RepID=A0A560DN23_9BRAD|nr:hypothetical protein FBZ96_105200 [Bradyrhizobium stylosanthis]